MGAHYMECSSKEQDGVEDIFDMAVITAVGDEHKTPEEKHMAATTSRGTNDTFPSGGKKKKRSAKCTVL